MINKRNKLIVLLGPTACGKTKLAVKLAKVFNAEIVSADSRQVYQGMDVGTSKDLKEYLIRDTRNVIRDKVPYHLIDIISPKKQFSLAEYQKLAYQAIDDIIKRGKTPFLVGGTGLYLSSIIEGYQLSNVKPDLKLRRHLSMRTLKQLQQLVITYSIKLNQSDFNNKRRLIRAIEKVKSGIRDIRYKIRDTRYKIQDTRYNCLILGIKYPKKVINQRIDQRLLHRLEKEKLIEEVKKLHKNGVSWKRLDDFGLEYKWIALYLQKKITYDEMVEKLKIAIHQFAKRQMTWFSAHGGSASGGKRMKNVHWIKNVNKAKELIGKFI